jgi:hypothetical protein
MTKTHERQLRTELRQLEQRGRDILAGRYAPWGLPWCAGPGAPYHQPPNCEGCAGREWARAQAAPLMPRVAELRARLAPPPVQAALW